MLKPLFLLCLLALLGACSPPTAPAQLSPVFILLCDDIDPEMEPHPCCTGFASGGQVVTANHCVPDARHKLVSNRQWLTTSDEYQIGTVTARDPAHDIAWVSAMLDGPGLELGSPVAMGDAVHALTRWGVKDGLVEELSGNFWRSSLDTEYGDSGSAIVDESGAAVGVLTRCLTADEKQCDAETGMFVAF